MCVSVHVYMNATVLTAFKLLLLCTIYAGPTSIAHTTIETVSGKNMKVKYLPAEVGEYTIILLWNDNEVDGKLSPCFKLRCQVRYS